MLLQMHSKPDLKQILDCLKGLYYSQKLGWFDYKKFDLAEYENYEKLENGDINWIIPNKFIAFSSPYDKTSDSSVFYLLNRINILHPKTLYLFLKNWG
jgi:hypothetical protein